MARSQLSVAVALVLALVLAAAMWMWLLQADEPCPTPGSPGATPSAERVAEVADGGTEAEIRSGVPVGIDREAAPAIADLRADENVDEMRDGEAMVRVTTRDAQGRVQPDVVVTASPLRGNRIDAPVGKGRTDEQGRIEFAGLRPCKLLLDSDRRDSKSFVIAAGLNELEFVVTAGIDVVGRVLDPDGAPVAGAEIWLQTASNAWDGGRVLGLSDGDGAFALAHVASNCSLGACASGFSPSPLVDLEIVDRSATPAVVELRLASAGGDLTGLVADPDGRPVGGAQVAVGDQSRTPDWQNDRVVEVWGVRTVASDANGRYVLAGVPPGRNVLTARAAGFGIRRLEATVTASETTTLDVTLVRSASLFGTVTDKDGVPEVGARVSAFDREPGTSFVAGGQIDFDLPFGHVETLADEHGAYRLEGITPGTVWLFAQRRSASGSGGVSVALRRDTIEVADGSEVRWDPVIDVGRTIEGVVRYRDGYPIPYLFVTLHDERSGAEHVLNSDDGGRFRFLCLDDSTYEVRVQPPFDAPRGNVPPRRSGVVPDGAPVEFTVEYDKPQRKVPGKVRGSIADLGGRLRNANAATVTLHSDAGWFRPGIKVENGAFVVDEVEPCRFRIILKEGETVLAATGWFELLPAGDVDVGRMTTEPGGAVMVQVSRAKGAEGFEPKLYLRREGDPLSTTIELGRGNAAFVDSLTPGSYSVSGYCRGMIAVDASVEVRAGETAQLAVELRPGAVGVIAVWWPEGHTGSTRRGYRVTDAGGEVVQDHEGALYTSPTRPYEMHFTLPAGRHRLEFWTNDGLRGELDFEIPVDLVAPALQLELK